ncbi:MAG: hypothetical protein KIT83_07555 [Bryobacterales bacterium]|nr:hypothetical protein [Bryobacterales bacterium]
MNTRHYRVMGRGGSYTSACRPTPVLLQLLLAMLVVSMAVGQTAGAASGPQWKVTEKDMSLAEFRAIHCEGSGTDRLTGYTGIQRNQADPVLGRFSKCLPEGIELKQAFSAGTPVPVEYTVIPWEVIAVVECDEPRGRAGRKRTGALVALGGIAAGLALGFRERETAGFWIGAGSLASGTGIARSMPEHRLRVRILE